MDLESPDVGPITHNGDRQFAAAAAVAEVEQHADVGTSATPAYGISLVIDDRDRSRLFVFDHQKIDIDRGAIDAPIFVPQ